MPSISGFRHIGLRGIPGRSAATFNRKLVGSIMNVRLVDDKTALARPVAAEDLHRRDFIAVLNETLEYPSFLWCWDSHMTTPHEPVTIQWQSFDNGLVLRVEDICLPFVFVKQPCGDHKTLDIRRCQLVRLDIDYAKRVWKATGSKGKKSAKRRRKSRKRNR